MKDANHTDLMLVYDGECPFCSRYVTLVRLREAVGPVQLIDARQGGPVVEKIQRMGYDINEGMVLVDGETIYFGEDCIHRLALLSSPSTTFNRMNAAIFRSKTASDLLYPVLKLGRRGILTLLGRRRIAPAAARSHEDRREGPE